ncbi:hypothetical protein A2U01_0082777, partial [Trifolium medium]|nr:hypothetical protein [Trifolium medium]
MTNLRWGICETHK